MAIRNVNTEWIDLSYKIPVAKTGHIKRKWEDVPYGDHPLQQSDIYLPEEGDGPFPVIVNVHGGGFMHCDKRDFHLYPTMYALQRGYAVMAVNYRLSPEVRYPVHLQDVENALVWLSVHGREYSLDVDNVFLWGTSAGGNLVLHAACKKGRKVQETGFPYGLSIRATAAFCPALDMTSRQVLGNVLQKCWLKITLAGMMKSVFGKSRPDAEEMVQSDPETYLEGGITPLYLMHGELDPIIPEEQAAAFARKAAKLLPDGDMVYHRLLGAPHAGADEAFFTEEHVGAVLDFFERKREYGNKIADQG